MICRLWCTVRIRIEALSVFVLSAAVALLNGVSVSTHAVQPNFVVILVDDMGWRDVGFAGNAFVETPHIDRLARDGIIFSQAYASAPNCAPTRACLLSGQYPTRHGVYTVVDERHSPGQAHHRLLAAQSNPEMASEVFTLSEALKGAGYATSCFGMWNLGRGRDTAVSPEGQGFDTFKRPQDLGFERNTYFNKDGSYLPDRLTEEALRFMFDHRADPFFVYFAPHSVHAPFDPKPELVEKYRQKSGADQHDALYAATIHALDWNVGRIRGMLEKLGIADRTTVVFTSDNGANRQYTAPLNGGKGQLYEGGLRVPACVWGYGVTAKGSTYSSPVATIDIYPTLLGLAGIAPPEKHLLDGVSWLPVLKGESVLDRDTLYWHFPCYLGQTSPCSAIRHGDFKLIEFFERAEVELYNLVEDPHERLNLATKNPEQADRLYNMLRAWQRETNAAMPNGSNPNFDVAAKAGKNKQKEKGRKKRLRTSHSKKGAS